MKKLHDDCGPVTHEEASKIAQAYIDHTFRNDERPDFQGMKPRHSIPASPR
jgi:hypothetical protein